MLPRRFTVSARNATLILVCVAMSFIVLFAALDDAQKDLRDAELRTVFIEGQYRQAADTLERYDTVLTQCLAWQGRVSYDLGALARACNDVEAR